MTEEKKQAFIERIASANKSELVVVVYDIALTYVEDAVAGLTAGDDDGYKAALDGIQRCVQDLINSLNMDIEFSKQLFNVYGYLKKQLSLVRINKDSAVLEQIKWALSELGESFAVIAKQDESGSVFEATEHVMAGMTYGKGVLNENIVNQNSHSFSV